MYKDSKKWFYNGGVNYNQNMPLSAQLGYFVPLNGLYCIAIPSPHHQSDAATHSPSLSRQTLR